MSRDTKKYYQQGGDIRAMEALRDLQGEQNIEKVLGETAATASDLGFAKAVGDTKEKQEAAIKAAQEAIERRQKKSNKLLKSLKILDFFPGGKFLKMAVKGFAAGNESKKMKDLLKSLNISGFENSIFENNQDAFNDMIETMEKTVNPLQAMTQSIAGDIIGGKMGETFGEAFKNKKFAAETTEKGLEDNPWLLEPDMFGDIEFDKSIKSKFSPWKDQFKDQFNIDGGYFDLTGGTGMNLLNMLGFGDPDDTGFFQGEFFNPSKAQTGFNLYGGGGLNTGVFDNFLSRKQK